MSLKRFDCAVWNDSFWRAFIASGFMSIAKMFFGGKYFEAVFARIPEPVPISKNFMFLFFLINFGNSFLSSSANKYESSDGWYISIKISLPRRHLIVLL